MAGGDSDSPGRLPAESNRRNWRAKVGIGALASRIRERIERIRSRGVRESVTAKAGGERNRPFDHCQRRKFTTPIDRIPGGFDIRWPICTRNPALARGLRSVDRRPSNVPAFFRSAAKPLNSGVSSPSSPSAQGRFRCAEQLLKQNCKKVVDANQGGA